MPRKGLFFNTKSKTMSKNESKLPPFPPETTGKATTNEAYAKRIAQKLPKVVVIHVKLSAKKVTEQ